MNADKEYLMPTHNQSLLNAYNKMILLVRMKSIPETVLGDITPMYRHYRICALKSPSLYIANESRLHSTLYNSRRKNGRTSGVAFTTSFQSYSNTQLIQLHLDISLSNILNPKWHIWLISAQGPNMIASNSWCDLLPGDQEIACGERKNEIPSKRSHKKEHALRSIENGKHEHS